jgi:hypothetical protein
LNKHRINTTISAKHWQILEKYTKNFETQQKVLETALESIENGSKQNCVLKQSCPFFQVGHDGLFEAKKAACIVHKDIMRALIETSDAGRFKEIICDYKPFEHLIAHYYQKPLQKCSLKEILDGLIFFNLTGNLLDTMNYTDEGDHYILKVVHSLSYNCSTMLKFIIESVIEAYGVKTESEISEKFVFMKIYKNSK